MEPSPITTLLPLLSAVVGGGQVGNDDRGEPHTPEVVDWLADAGFTDASHIPLPKSPGYSLMVDRKQ
ncbi:MAG: hypothetical protein U5K30_02690 [Acidimicrobiales bacterium]|nr:hypothetical protein [Acidimicrobiales bacterium]